MNATGNEYSRKEEQEEYSRSVCSRSCFIRPLPQGKRVYLVLLQFMLLNIIEVHTTHYSEIFIATYYKKWNRYYLGIVISLSAVALLLCLPMGFIADRYYGKFKVLSFSWKLLFVTQVLFGICFVIFSCLSYKTKIRNIITGFCCVLLIPYAVGLAGVRVNLIPFGVDQIPLASSDEISSYFHCYYWFRNVGWFIACSAGASLIASKKLNLVSWFLSSICAAIGTVVNVYGYRWFIVKGKVGNPLLLIYRVLRYSVTVRRPALRSAFSFDGRPKPSRIDLAKETHFGIFKDEIVEDVKTFLRILVLLISLLGFLCVHSLITNVYGQQSLYLKQLDAFTRTSDTSCPNQTGSHNITINHINHHYTAYWVVLLNVGSVLILLPLLDRIIYPFCHPRISSMFGRIGVGMLASLASISCALAVEAVRFYAPNKVHGHPHLVNAYHTTGWAFVASPVSVAVMIPQFFFLAVAESIALITMVEFIYAQSPAYMKGLLLGCLFFTEGCATVLASLLFLFQANEKSPIWSHSLPVKLDDLCASIKTGSNLGAYSIIAVCTVLGFLLFLYSAAKYVSRIRDTSLLYYI